MHHLEITQIKNSKERATKFAKNSNQRYSIIRKLLRRHLKGLVPRIPEQYIMLPSLLVTVHGVVARYQFKKPASLVVAKKSANKLVRKRDWAWVEGSSSYGNAAMNLPELIEK